MRGNRSIVANLLRYLKQDRILVRMGARKKVEAIRELAGLLEDAPEISAFRQFLSVMIQKELRFGSGVGDGVAIPHYRDETIEEPVIGLGVSRNGIEWGEGERVSIVVLIGWPNKHDQAYLKTVAEIARLLHEAPVRQALLNADSEIEVLEILKGALVKPESVSC